LILLPQSHRHLERLLADLLTLSPNLFGIPIFIFRRSSTTIERIAAVYFGSSSAHPELYFS
jgi:hypothetical protein